MLSFRNAALRTALHGCRLASVRNGRNFSAMFFAP